MRRAVAILKYVPAALCGLLVVAWVVSVILPIGICTVETSKASPSRGRGGWYLIDASLVRYRNSVEYPPTHTHIHIPDLPTAWEGGKLGSFLYESRYSDFGSRDFMVWLPIPALLTLLTPLAIGPTICFRFPLWSYFAWTALIAAELAYYLR